MRKDLRTRLQLIIFVCTLGGMAHAQPMQVTQVPENSTNFTTIGNLVYFTSGDALWRTDGTEEGTVRLRSGFDGFSEFIEFNGKLVFRSAGTTISASRVWRELWTSDGTQSGTVLLKSSMNYDVSIAGTTPSYLFFAASESNVGYELFRTNGTPDGTSLVKDINPGPASSFNGRSAATGSQLFFAADDGEHGVEIWRTDGAAEGTIMIKDINAGNSNSLSQITTTFAHNGNFFFIAHTPDHGSEPWVTDGTAEGTILLQDIEPGSEGINYAEFKIANNGEVFFFVLGSPDDDQKVDVIWKTSGTPSSTERVAAFEASSSHYFTDFLKYKGKVFFFVEGDGDIALWYTDGTSEGTGSVWALTVGNGYIPFAEVVNNHILFYPVVQTSAYRFERSDGVPGNTQTFDIFHSASYDRGPRDVTKVNNMVLYGDHDQGEAEEPEPDNYFQLVQSDGFTTQAVRNIHGGSYSGVVDIANYNGHVLFTTLNDRDDQPDDAKQLWIYDPQSATEPVAHFTLVDADTDEDIQPLNDGDVYSMPESQNINITYTPVGTVGSVVFAINDKRVRTETQPPYSLAGDVNGNYAPWQEAEPGTYKLTATPYSGSGGEGTAGESLTINFTIEEAGPTVCTASGMILREHWANVSGTTVPAVPVDEEPTSTSQLTIFEGPSNIGDNYGARIRGYICPPATGAYTFWIASNDHSELWLSTDDNPANRVRIANLTRATNPREWTKFASQRSAPVNLIAGKRYYIEALHKEGIGTDHIAVGWQLPDGTMERPIQGSRLSPANPGDNTGPVVSLTSPDDGATFTTPADITITADASDADGTIARVEFFEGSNLLFADHNAPYSFAWNNVSPGTYTLTARATDNSAASTTSESITITVTSGACTASGTIAREVWSDVEGTRVSDIPQESPPESVHELSAFEGPTNSGTNYGARIRGYICPPATGGYTFWIASNDHSELWLSTDDDPANKVRIAWADRATEEREWDRFLTQRSAVIQLQQGQTYYIEALHKQGIGGDHVAVGWQLPDGTLERPIGGSRLSPFEISQPDLAITDESAFDAARYSQISVYPNPAQDTDGELTISGYEGIDETIETQVEIVSMTGEVVFTEKVRCGGDCDSYLMKMNKQLVPGLYMVNLKADRVKISKRLLVE